MYYKGDTEFRSPLKVLCTLCTIEATQEILKTMSDTTTITVRLDASLKAKLEKLARSTQRSKSWLAAEAIAAYIEQESWQIEAIEKAIEQADRPNPQWIAHGDVSAWLKTWGTSDETTAPCP
jgi:RHH-type transcriptional regulator, rel operon repressor / antitoxin RelB